jgi:hypothetical protein
MTESSWTESSVYTTPRSILGLELMWSLRLDEARAIFQHELAEYDRLAMYTVRQGPVLPGRARVSSRKWIARDEARGRGHEHRRGVRPDEDQSHVVLFNQAWGAALLGEVERRADGHRWCSARRDNDDPFNGA